jgi:hypothetical protein
LDVQKKFFLKSKYLIKFDSGETHTLALKRSDKKGKIPFEPIMDMKMHNS